MVRYTFKNNFQGTNMKKTTTTLLALTLSASTLLAAEAQEVNTGKGFYMGAGLGASIYNVSLSDSTYLIKDENNVEYTVDGNNLEELDDTDLGYVLYAGYLINKIIGVEGSLTNYGAFSGTIKETNKKGDTIKHKFTKKPKSMAVYANAGYTFLNGQLRPFGNLGLGYLKTYQSKTYSNLQFQGDFATLHYGVGVDYYPTVLKGFGVRASYVGDSYADSQIDTIDGPDSTTKVDSTTLWQSYSLFFVSAQYKF